MRQGFVQGVWAMLMVSLKTVCAQCHNTKKCNTEHNKFVSSLSI